MIFSTAQAITVRMGHLPGAGDKVASEQFAYFMATRLDFGEVGLWCGMVVGAGFSVLLLLWRFKSKIKHY